MAFRVVVVDDSAVIRRIVTTALEGCPDIEVAGIAQNGKIALDVVDRLKPDIVTLDIEMPVMNGLETLDHLHRKYPRLPIVMFSTLTAKGASITLDALERGARDFVTKPSNTGSMDASMQAVRDSLIPLIRGLCSSRLGIRPATLAPPRPGMPPAPPAQPGLAGRPSAGALGLPPRAAAPAATRPTAPAAPAPSENKGNRVSVLAIGSSTGGPEAVQTVLSGIPGHVRVPIVLTQHMPPVFTKQFSERLNMKLPLSVKEAETGDILQPGHVYVAPGDYHMTFARSGANVVVKLNQEEKENFCRPAVDPMFRSLAEVYGAGVLATILTGMGSDGAKGAGNLLAVGGSVYVQDEATSVVWGMPGATVALGNAQRVLPIKDIAPTLMSRIGS